MDQRKGTLNIAIIDHSPDVGGAEASILTLLRKIDRTRYQVTVILPFQGDFFSSLKEIDAEAKIIPLPMGVLRLKRGSLRSFPFLLIYLVSLQFFLLKLCLYIRSRNFHMVVTNTVKSHFYGSLAARLCGKPLVWRFHDILSPEDFHPLLIKLIVLFGKLFPRKILAVSKMTRDSLIQNGFDQEKVDVIYNGIDVERFGGPVSKDLRLELDPEGRTVWVGCIGRIVPQKGQKIFLQSIPLVLRTYSGAFFLIIGDAFLKEKEYQKELLEIVRKNGIGEHVKFVGFRKDIRTLIQGLDVVVFPSVAPESFGLSIAEAMLLGKAVIASDIGGVGELVETGVTGILVKPGDPEELADRIIYLLSHREIRERIGRKAEEGVNKTFPPEIYVRAMEKAFRETMGIYQ